LMKQNSRDIEETGRKLGISRFLMWIWAYCAGTFDQDWIKFKGYCAFFFLLIGKHSSEIVNCGTISLFVFQLEQEVEFLDLLRTWTLVIFSYHN
jgi:hypothetical protein